MRNFILLISFLIPTAFVFSQEEILPIWLTEEEKQQLETYDFTSSNFERNGITTPPSGNLRNMAEWEEVSHLLLTWVPTYDNTLLNIVQAAINDVEIIIITNNTSHVENLLTNAGVDLNKVTFIVRNYDTIWIRDYAANSVYTDWNDGLILVDWIYNRPRPNDNSSPEAVANELNIPLYQMTEAPTDVVATGGNWMTDGFGTGFSSMLIVDENAPGNQFGVTGKTEAELDDIFNDFMGVQEYIKMENLDYDAIDHIDMHMKLLDEETILVSEYPPGVADGPQIEANIQYVIDNYQTVFGNDFEIIKIPAPPSTSGLYPDNNGYYRTYTNSVILNNTVIVPFYREEYDTTAQRIYEEAMPGYNIVGVNVDGENGEQLISMGGAIHCITHSVGTQSPMIISHEALQDTYDNINPYEVEAYISHKDGIETAILHYKHEDSINFESVNMTHDGNENWSGLIPAHLGETDIDYYIEAEATTGKVQKRPMPAPDGYWTFTVFEEDNLSTENLDVSIEVSVYPNPASSITAIELGQQINDSGTLEIYDITGNKVKTIHEGNFSSKKRHFFFDANEFKPGAYFISLETNKHNINRKVIVK